LVVVTALALFAVVLVGRAAAQAECTLSVEPKVADTGSEFHLLGSGFTPTQLTLQKGAGTPTTIDLNLGDQDPFDIPITSQPGDEGKWTATVSVPGGCSESVQFTATLENTDTMGGLLSPVSTARLPLAVVILTIVAGLTGGALVARRLK